MDPFLMGSTTFQWLLKVGVRKRCMIFILRLVPGIIEKVYQVEQRSVPASPEEHWRTGGIVKTGEVLTAAMEGDETTDVGHERIVCVYDLLSCDALFSDLRYVLDARQPRSDTTSTLEVFESRHAFPAKLTWYMQRRRAAVREFTRDVYV